MGRSGDSGWRDLAADRPQERRHLAGDGSDDDGPLLAGCIEPTITAAQPDLGLPGDVADRLWQGQADRNWNAPVPEGPAAARI